MRVDKKSFDLNFNPLSLKIINLLLAKIGYFTVIVRSKAGVELVLIHTSLLCYISNGNRTEWSPIDRKSVV